MSLQAAHRALYGLEGVDLNAQQRLVLIFIADHVNDETGLAWMSLQRVATFAGMSQRAVRRAIGGLKDAGVLDVVERPGRTSLYRIITPPEPTPTTSDRGTPTASVPPADPTPTTDDRGTPTTNDRGQNPTPTTSGRTPRTLMEGELLMNQQQDDDDDSARGAPPGPVDFQRRVDLARQIIPDTWTGLAVHGDNSRLGVLDELEARGWTIPDLRTVCAGLPRPRANPTGLLARHLAALADTDPDHLATRPADPPTPTPPTHRPECDHGAPLGAACHDCDQEQSPW